MRGSRRCAIGFALVVGLAGVLAAGAAQAQYGEGVASRAATGFNGVLTAVADPVAMTVQPPETLRNMSGGIVLQYPFGLIAGTTVGVWRVITGGFDMLFCWVPEINRTSPAPRFRIVPGTDEE